MGVGSTTIAPATAANVVLWGFAGAAGAAVPVPAPVPVAVSVVGMGEVGRAVALVLLLV